MSQNIKCCCLRFVSPAEEERKSGQCILASPIDGFEIYPVKYDYQAEGIGTSLAVFEWEDLKICSSCLTSSLLWKRQNKVLTTAAHPVGSDDGLVEGRGTENVITRINSVSPTPQAYMNQGKDLEQRISQFRKLPGNPIGGQCLTSHSKSYLALRVYP